MFLLPGSLPPAPLSWSCGATVLQPSSHPSSQPLLWKGTLESTCGCPRGVRRLPMPGFYLQTKERLDRCRTPTPRVERRSSGIQTPSGS